MLAAGPDGIGNLTTPIACPGSRITLQESRIDGMPIQWTYRM
jgi:hypothetical protein